MKPVLLCPLSLLLACSSRTTIADSSTETDGINEAEADSGSEVGSESESDGPDLPLDCGGFSLEPVFTPAHVMLVVDGSASLVGSWDHDADVGTPVVGRWSSARSVVEAMLAEVPMMNFGLQRFPSADACPNGCSDADVCLVAGAPEVAVAPETGEDILASLPESDADVSEFVGGSPTRAAFESARDHLLADDPVVPKYIVLITDGGANCGVGSTLPDSFEVYDDGLLEVVGDAFTQEIIQTLVVGVDVLDETAVPGVDAPQINRFEALNELAIAGGVPWNMGMDARKFFDAGDPQEVIDAIGNILACVTSCAIDLNQVRGGPPAPDQIPFVTLETEAGMQIPYVADCANEHGWTWIVEGEILSLCGSYCDGLQAGEAIYGDYGCPGE